MKKYTALLFFVSLLIPWAASADYLDSREKVSLQVEAVPMATVLDMLARQFDLNIVMSGQVEGEITLRLDEVDLRSALNAILVANEYNYYLTDNIVIVKPLAMDTPGETVVRTFQLQYISPAAVAGAIEALLSAKGKIKIIEDPAGGAFPGNRPQATSLIVVDLPEVVALVTEFIEQVDVRQRQISIEVRMIEVSVDGEKNYGFKWPTKLGARLHGAGSEGEGEDDMISGASGEIDLPDGRWEWGKLSLDEVDVMLEFLEKQGNSKLISDPRISALNNHTAEIKVATVVPIQTINRFSEGGAVQDIVTFQDEEVGITLRVTPQIVDGDNILLDVHPTVAEIVGYSGTADNQKPITSERSVKTKITVRDTESAVLGGLLKENKIETSEGIFFLSSIPILGNLFKHRSIQTETTDLLILITPTIIRD